MIGIVKEPADNGSGLLSPASIALFAGVRVLPAPLKLQANKLEGDNGPLSVFVTK